MIVNAMNIEECIGAIFRSIIRFDVSISQKGSRFLTAVYLNGRCPRHDFHFDWTKRFLFDPIIIGYRPGPDGTIRIVLGQLRTLSGYIGHPWEEPQIIFRNDAIERFDEALRYVGGHLISCFVYYTKKKTFCIFYNKQDTDRIHTDLYIVAGPSIHRCES